MPVSTFVATDQMPFNMSVNADAQVRPPAAPALTATETHRLQDEFRKN
jgi:hypothetical protein